MRYLLRVYDADTASVHEEAVEAASADEAPRQLTSVGKVVLSVRATAAPAARRATLDVAWWCRELRTLVDAGMTVVEALETLRAQSLGAAREHVHETLVQQLRQGQALSDAMRATQSFPAMLVAGVKAGERTSALVPALDDYLRYHDAMDQLKRKAVSAAIYPSLVLGLGLLITGFLLVYVVPRFSRMYADLSGPVSPATRALMAVSAALTEHHLLLGGAAAAAVLAALWAWRAGAWGRLFAATIEAVPPLRRWADEFRLAKLYQSLALMFRGGYALDDALRQCESLGLGQRLREGVLAAGAALQRGQRVSSAFAAGGLTDAVTQRLLAVGERTGNFDRVLNTVAERHAQNFGTLMERATRIVEPVMLMSVALLVGGLVVMMYMPVFDMASSVR